MYYVKEYTMRRLSVILVLVASLALNAHASSIVELLPMPPKPAPFSTAAANGIIENLENITAKYNAATDEAIAKRDSGILEKATGAAKAAVEPLYGQFVAAGETLSGDEKERFKEYANALVMRLASIEEAAEDIIADAQMGAAPAAPSSQPYGKNFPTPTFKTPALNAFVAEYDAYVEESIRLAIETIQTGDITDLDAHFQKKTVEMETKAEALAESAPENERALFKSYLRRQLGRNSKAYSDAYKASEVHKKKNQAPLAEKNFPTPVFRHPELNDFIKEYDAQVEELLRLAAEAIQTGDDTKYSKFQEETQKSENDPHSKANAILGSINATNTEGDVLSGYIFDQQARVKDAHSAVHVPDFRRPLDPPYTTAELVARVAPKPSIATQIPPAPQRPASFKTPGANDMILKIEAYMEETIRLADDALATGSWSAFSQHTGQPFERMQEESGNMTVEVANKERHRFKDISNYTSDQLMTRMNAINDFLRNPQFKPVPVPVAGSPAITAHPADATVNAGQPATFTAAATGDPAPDYQWQYEGKPDVWYDLKEGPSFNGVTTGTITLTKVNRNVSGYRYRCVIKNDKGTVTTNPATITVK